MKDWKACERKIAAILGGVRVPVTGRQRGATPDVEHPVLSIEVKSRKSFPAWLLDALEHRERPATCGRLAPRPAAVRGQSMCASAWGLCKASEGRGKAMSRCAFIKAGGERCKAGAMSGSSYCYNHEPGKAEERKRNASKGGNTGGRGRPGSGEITRLRAQLKTLTSRVVEGELDTSRGAVANQLIGTQVRLLEFERRLRETEELEERLEAIEATLKGRKTG